MFILRALLSFEARRGPRILIFSPTVWFVPDVKQRAEMTLEGGKSKSAGLKWQQCPSKWTLIVANIIQLCELCHYAMCNREEMKTLHCLYLTVMSSCFWQSVNEHSVMLFRAKISLTPWWRAENGILTCWICK